MNSTVRSLTVAVFVSGCSGRCNEPGSAEPPETSLPAIQWRIAADGHEGLELVAATGSLEASGAAGRVRWRASGARGRWIHSLELSLAVNRLDPGRSSLNLLSSRCRVRYLQDGRETEADYSVDEADIESLAFSGGQWTGRLRLRCRKVVETRSDGATYAEGVPATLTVTGTAWAR